MKKEVKYIELKEWSADYEQQILVDVSMGDHGAFRQLYLHYYDRLFQFALGFLSSKAAAEDVVETVFFNILKNPQALAAISNFKSYIYRAVRNTSLNVLKSGYVSGRDNDSRDWFEVDIVYPGTPIDEVTYRELRAAIKAAVNLLPDRCRLIFKLSREDRMSQKEIADALGVKLSTVARQLMIAKERIRRAIQPFTDKL